MIDDHRLKALEFALSTPSAVHGGNSAVIETAEMFLDFLEGRKAPRIGQGASLDEERFKMPLHGAKLSGY